MKVYKSLILGIWIISLLFIMDIDARRDPPEINISNQQGDKAGRAELQERPNKNYDFFFIPEDQRYSKDRLNIYNIDRDGIDKLIYHVSMGYIYDTYVYDRDSLFYVKGGRNTETFSSSTHITGLLHDLDFEYAEVILQTKDQEIDYLSVCPEWNPKSWQCPDGNWSVSPVTYYYDRDRKTISFRIFNFSAYHGSVDFYTGFEDADSNLCNGGSNFTNGFCNPPNTFRGNQMLHHYRGEYGAEEWDNTGNRVFTRRTLPSASALNQEVSVRAYVYVNSSELNIQSHVLMLWATPPSAKTVSFAMGLNKSGHWFCMTDPTNASYNPIIKNLTNYAATADGWHYIEVYAEKGNFMVANRGKIKCAVDGDVFYDEDPILAGGWQDGAPFNHIGIGQLRNVDVGNMTIYWDEVMASGVDLTLPTPFNETFPIGGFPNITNITQTDNITDNESQTIIVTGFDFDDNNTYEAGNMNSSWIEFDDEKIIGIRDGDTFNITINTTYYGTLDRINYTVYINDSRGLDSQPINGTFIISESNEEDKYILYYGFLFFTAFLLLILGRKTNNFLIEFSSGVLFVAVALGLANQGIPSFDHQTLEMSSIIIALSIGIYTITRSAIEEIK